MVRREAVNQFGITAAGARRFEQHAALRGTEIECGGRKFFGALLLGAYQNGTLEYIGHCGTGFNEAALKELHGKFKPYFTSASPIDRKIKVNAKVQWIKPHFVCQVKFTEWTSDGSMRHPVYLGLRTDKKPAEVKKEIPKAMKKDKSTNEMAATLRTTILKWERPP